MLYFKRLLLEFKLIRKLYKDNYVKGDNFWPTLKGQNFTILHTSSINGNSFIIEHNNIEYSIDSILIKILFNKAVKRINKLKNIKQLEELCSSKQDTL